MTLFDPPEPKPKKALRDPAIAAAVSKCIIARLEPQSRLTWMSHPTRCRFCDFPFGRLLDGLNDFNAWAGWGALDRPPGRPDPDFPELEPQVEAFMQLPVEEQQRLTAIAAGYPPDVFAQAERMYPGRKHMEAQGKRMEAQRREKGLPVEQPVIDDKKAAGPVSPDPQPGSVGGRNEAGHRRGRGIGGPETPAGAGARGLSDRGPEAPGPEEDDSPVQDRYHDTQGRDLPF